MVGWIDFFYRAERNKVIRSKNFCRDQNLCQSLKAHFPRQVGSRNGITRMSNDRIFRDIFLKI